jgi:uncharacterized protein with FMN-binding domain
MKRDFFIKGVKSLAPALSVLLIVALMVTPTLQAAIPGVYEVAAAEPSNEESSQGQPAMKVSVKKSPKKETSKPAAGAGSLGDTIDLANKKFKDGTYTGSGIGYVGTIQVAVTIRNGAIATIKVTKHREDQPYMRNAMVLISRIIRTQGVKVDTVTGATYTSRGIINAVKDALKKAIMTEDPELDVPAGDEIAPPQPPAGDGSDPAADEGYEPVLGMYLDGTYKGLARGYKSLFQATVIIVDGNIVSIDITHADDDDYYAACEGIIGRIITRQTTDGIDTVTGCTLSSRAILDSVKNALTKALKPEMPEGKNEDDDDTDMTPEPAGDDDTGTEAEPSAESDDGTGGGGDNNDEEPEAPGNEDGINEGASDESDDTDSGAEAGEGEGADEA